MQWWGEEEEEPDAAGRVRRAMVWKGGERKEAQRRGANKKQMGRARRKTPMRGGKNSSPSTFFAHRSALSALERRLVYDTLPALESLHTDLAAGVWVMLREEREEAEHTPTATSVLTTTSPLIHFFFRRSLPPGLAGPGAGVCSRRLCANDFAGGG